MVPMTRLRTKRHQRQGHWTLFALVSVSMAIHAAIAVSAEFQLGHVLPADRQVAKSAASYAFSCTADANLSLGARSLSCTLPGIHSEQCQRNVFREYRFDLLLCEGLKETEEVQANTVAFLSPEEIAKIEPEALMDVAPVDEIEAAKLLEAEIEKKVEEAKQTMSQPVAKGQIIEVLKPEVEMMPDKARFVSEFNTKTDKETVARGSTEKMISNPAVKELPVAENPPPLPEEIAPPQKNGAESNSQTNLDVKTAKAKTGAGDTANQPPVLAMRETKFRKSSTEGETNGIDALAANGLAAAKLGTGDRTREGQRAREGQEAAKAGSGAQGGIPNLRPSNEMLARALGGGSVDKLDGVESGEVTALNSKKWKYASFFNRMKRQVAQNWNPAEIYQQRDPEGRVYGTKNRETLLEVFLKPNGSLDRVVVLKSSGIDFLDDEAASAFQRAQPFPNPPTGLLDTGSQRIRFSFGFHFQVGSRRDSWKVFRYR